MHNRDIRGTPVEGDETWEYLFNAMRTVVLKIRLVIPVVNNLGLCNRFGANKCTNVLLPTQVIETCTSIYYTLNFLVLFFFFFFLQISSEN